MIVRVIVFLILNFGALTIGGLFTGKGVPSDWYVALIKAPWTPPGWVFGFAWTTIMICFSVFMAYLWPAMENRKQLVALYAIQWILNVSWNPIFFYLHQVGLALIVIILLTILIGFVLFYSWPLLKTKALLIAPYFIWLLIASSLNGYIFVKN